MDAALSRFGRLSERTALLADALSVAAVLEQGIEVLGASGGSVVLPNADGSALCLVGWRGVPASAAEPWKRIPLTARVPTATAYRSGRTVVVRSRDEREALFPDMTTEPTDERVSLALPLRGRGGMLGAISFAFGSERP